jgi:hypothetical protein
MSNQRSLVTFVILVLACIGVSGLVVSFQYENTIAFAQTNSTTGKASASTRTVPQGGIQLLLLVKKGGLAGQDQLFSYNIISKELTFVDLKNSTVKTKPLSSSEVENLTRIFYSTNITREKAYDVNVCPDCFQYGLSYSFLDLEKLVPFHGMAFWTNRTPDVAGLKMLADEIEQLSPK